MTKIIEKKLKITGMHCTSCALNIDLDLEEVSGVISVKTNYAKQESVVEFDQDKIKLADIQNQIKKTGYTSTE